jgi:hypothetical protein
LSVDENEKLDIFDSLFLYATFAKVISYMRAPLSEYCCSVKFQSCYKCSCLPRTFQVIEIRYF